jgi:quinol-cytochrome oxidoreductase complex cytochrome b subunit
LGYIGAQNPDANFFTGHVDSAHPAFITNMLVGQLATFYYFFHFLVIMPVLGMIETPKPLPVSISEAVLKKHKITVQA